MKKLTALILVLILICLAPLSLAEDWYLSTAEALSQRLSVLVGNQTYLEKHFGLDAESVASRVLSDLQK